MPRKKSEADEHEINFDLNNSLWEEYLEWCSTGYVIRDTNGTAVALSTKPSVSDFVIWKQTMGYFTEDE